jgi:pilus assembly protein CpaE
MAHLSAVITTTDQDFRAQVTRLLRGNGVGVADERHLANGAAPDLVMADIRGGAASVQWALERVRTMWPQTVIIAVAGASDPDQILMAMRAGANEFLAWPAQPTSDAGLQDSVRTALGRATERLRATRGGERRSGRVLSFFGAKGGAGTTTLAVNTAIDLARTTKRPTLIVDLNQYLGEVALFLGLRPRYTIVDAIDNLHRLDASFLKELVAKHKSGVDMLAGAEQVDRPGPNDGPALEQLFQVLGRSYEIIIIDAGAVTAACAEVAVFAADTIYIVANPDVPSTRNAQRLVERMTQLGADRDKVRVLLNRASSDHMIAPKQIEQALGHPIDHVFASDYNTVSSALNAGVPLTLSDHSELASQFGAFTNAILKRQPEGEAVGARRRGHFLGLF